MLILFAIYICIKKPQKWSKKRDWNKFQSLIIDKLPVFSLQNIIEHFAITRNHNHNLLRLPVC